MPPTRVSRLWDLPPLHVPQHPDQHRPGGSDPPRSRSGARRRRDSQGSPELADPVGPLELGEHEDIRLPSKVTTDTATGITLALSVSDKRIAIEGRDMRASKPGKTIYLPALRYPRGVERVGRSMFDALGPADAGAAENRPLDGRAVSMRRGLDGRSPGNFEHLRRWHRRSTGPCGWWSRDSTALRVLPIDCDQHPHPSQREGGLPHTK
jgi:hypothetical protein